MTPFVFDYNETPMTATCISWMQELSNCIIDQLIPFLRRLMRVISQLTVINDKTLIAMFATIHLFSTVGLISFDRAGWCTLRLGQYSKTYSWTEKFMARKEEIMFLIWSTWKGWSSSRNSFDAGFRKIR